MSRQVGHSFTFCITNSGSTINVNDLIVIASRVGLCAKNATSGSEGNSTVLNGEFAVIEMKGIFQLTKSSGETISLGDNVYWNNSTKLITKTSGGNTYAGWVVEDAANGTTMCRVNLND